MRAAIDQLTEVLHVDKNDLDKVVSQPKLMDISNGIRFEHATYLKPLQWDIDNIGLVSYADPSQAESGIQIDYLVLPTGPWQPKGRMKQHTQPELLDIVSINFNTAYLSQFNHMTQSGGYIDDLLSLRHTQSFTLPIELCNKSLQVLTNLSSSSYTNGSASIFVHAQAQMLLLYGLEDCNPDKLAQPLVCKFTPGEIEKEKIYQARDILLQHLDNPITIKELSRKVALNECYLKKGFKEVVGSTIFEFFQKRRMEYARMLLYERGLQVTEVAELLGYSSISHFSTAFKKHTGMKPCELLLR